MSHSRSRAPLTIIGLVLVGAISVTALQRYSTGNPTGRAAGATGGCAGSVEPLAELPDDIRLRPAVHVQSRLVVTVEITELDIHTGLLGPHHTRTAGDPAGREQRAHQRPRHVKRRAQISSVQLERHAAVIGRGTI